MKTHEVAKLTGTTIRTLQYYDKIGLLSPKKDEQNGYREYDHSDLLILQQILFFRELDFSLSDIKEILTNPNYNQQDALQHQKQLLILKRDRFNHLIELVEDTMKGNHMPDFKAFDTKEIDAYTKEVKERWGTTEAYAQYQKKSEDYSRDTYQSLSEGAVCQSSFYLSYFIGSTSTRRDVAKLYHRALLHLHERDSSRSWPHVCSRRAFQK